MTKVFLSSTSKDLVEFRIRAEKAINSLDGYHCIAMENFGARDATAEEYCPDEVAKCDLFVLLLGPTYGSCPKNTDKSYTEQEWDEAVRLDKPRLVFASSKNFTVQQDLLMSLAQDTFQKAKAFRNNIGVARIWGEFATPEELAAHISRAISNWEKKQPQENRSGTRDKYLDHLIERNTDLNPRGVRQTERQVSLRLDQVYVALKAEREITVRDRRGFGARGPLAAEDDFDESWMVPGARLDHLSERRTEQAELSDAVREQSRIVVLGDPGAGKTTLLRFVALQFALACKHDQPTVRDKESTEYGETRLPIFFRVAEFAEAYAKDRNLNLRDFLPRPFGNAIKPDALGKVFDEALKQGSAFVMLDGLDEVVDQGDRAQIAQEIEEFVAGIDERNRVIVTSRIAGYREAPLGGDYQHFTLCDLEREQIERFLNRWCHATERFLSKDASEKEIERKASEEVTAILAAVDENLGVQRLAVNPLLLTILALIHRNGARLPNRRVDLYKLAAETLLKDRQLHRGIPTAKTISEDEAAQFLWPLAHWMHSEKPTGRATEREIKDKLAEFLAAKRALSEDDPEIIRAVNDFLDRLRRSTGILVERAPNQFGFLHLTFEEYFAARQLTRLSRKTAERIYAVRHKPRWEEPILLAIASASSDRPDDVADLIQTAILAEGEAACDAGFEPSLYEDVLHRDLLLAVQCIGDCATIEAGFRRRVVGRLVGLYLDSHGIGKYRLLRERILSLLTYLQNSEAADDVVCTLLNALHDINTDMRSRAAEVLGRLKKGTTEVVSGLLRALSDETSGVRTSAVNALGVLEIGTPEVVTSLLKMLGDEDADTYVTVCNALGEIGTIESISGLLENLEKIRGEGLLVANMMKGSMTESPEALSGFMNAINDGNIDVWELAANTFGGLLERGLEDEEELIETLGSKKVALQFFMAAETGRVTAKTPEVVDKLLRILDEKQGFVQLVAAFALANLEEEIPPDVVNRFLMALEDEDIRIRVVAQFAFTQIAEKTSNVVWGLLKTLRDSFPALRVMAADALGDLEEEAPEVVDGLLNALSDENERVRLAAAEAFKKLETGSSKVVDELFKALGDRSENVRRAVADALGELEEAVPEIVNKLLNALGDDNEDLRCGAAVALGKLEEGTPKVVDGLLKALTYKNKDIRCVAADALGNLKIGTPEVVDGLLKAVSDEDEKVRRAAAVSLGKMREGAPEVIALLLESLRNENLDVRSSVAEALIKISTPAVVSALLDALCEENDYIRINAACVLGELSKARHLTLQQEMIKQIAGKLRAMLDELQNQMREIRVGRRYYSNAYDPVWEALWLVCQRLEGQRA